MLQVIISGCEEHNYMMPNKLELSIGYQGDNYLFKCYGCANRGFMWSANAPQPTFLMITNYFGDKNSSTYCVNCSVENLDRLRRDLASRIVAFCPCSLCAFNNMTNLEKPEELLNSQNTINMCFCAFYKFDVLGKLSKEIIEYQKGEKERGYKNLSGFSER